MTSLRDSEGQPRVEGLMAISNVGLQEIIEHPFGKGQLTPDGEQFSTPGTGGTAVGAFSTAVLATANPPQIAGQIYELEFGLTSAIRMDSTAASTVDWQWQARSLGEGQDFRNLHAQDSSAFAAESTVYVEDTKSGRLNLDKDLDRFPIEIQLLITSENIEEDGVAKAKNSSYLRAVTSTLYRRAID